MLLLALCVIPVLVPYGRNERLCRFVYSHLFEFVDNEVRNCFGPSFIAVLLFGLPVLLMPAWRRSLAAS